MDPGVMTPGHILLRVAHQRPWSASLGHIPRAHPRELDYGLWIPGQFHTRLHVAPPLASIISSAAPNINSAPCRSQTLNILFHSLFYTRIHIRDHPSILPHYIARSLFFPISRLIIIYRIFD